MDILHRKILCICDHNQDLFCMDVCMAFYRIFQNISFCIQNARIYNCMAQYIFSMAHHIFVDNLSENMKSYNFDRMGDNFSCISYLSINDCIHSFYHILNYTIHGKFSLHIYYINQDKNGHILIIDCIFKCKLSYRYFSCIFPLIYGHISKQKFFLLSTLLFRKIFKLAFHNLLLLRNHK